MRGKIFAYLTCGTIAGVATAEPIEPARGSADRDALLSIARTLTGYDLGPPIELVVEHMRVDGDKAFMLVQPQRPGGVAIDISQTPVVLQREASPSMYDRTVLIAYLNKAEGDWYVFQYGIGSTDLWWVGYPYCGDYGFRSVMPDYGCPD